MKARSMYLTALFVMSVTLTALSKDEPAKTGLAVMSPKGSNVFKVIYKNENAGKVKLNIYNAKSEVIFSDAISSTSGFILPLNFNGLAFGEYTLELIDASGKKIEHISYQPAKTADNIRIAKMTNEEGKFIVSVMNAGSEKVTVRIFDTYNNLVHNENTDVTGDFARIYSFKNLVGTCTFEVSDDKGNVKTAQF